MFIIGKINKAFAKCLKVGDVEAAISRKLLGRFDPHSRLSYVYLVCPNRRSSTGYPLSFLDSFLTRRVPKMHQDATEARAPPFLASGFERATSNAGKRIAMNVKIGSTSESPLIYSFKICISPLKASCIYTVGCPSPLCTLIPFFSLKYP